MCFWNKNIIEKAFSDPEHFPYTNVASLMILNISSKLIVIFHQLFFEKVFPVI